jgi:hypothetical protein
MDTTPVAFSTLPASITTSSIATNTEHQEALHTSIHAMQTDTMSSFNTLEREPRDGLAEERLHEGTLAQVRAPRVLRVSIRNVASPYALRLALVLQASQLQHGKWCAVSRSECLHTTTPDVSFGVGLTVSCQLYTLNCHNEC